MKIEGKKFRIVVVVANCVCRSRVLQLACKKFWGNLQKWTSS